MLIDRQKQAMKKLVQAAKSVGNTTFHFKFLGGANDFAAFGLLSGSRHDVMLPGGVFASLDDSRYIE